MSTTEHRRDPKARTRIALWFPGALGEREYPEAPIPRSLWVPEGVVGAGDAELARLAEAQKGCVHRQQLLAAGVGPGAIRHRLKSGGLHSLYPDVYLVGRPRLERFARETAAVLHFAGHALASHDSGALLWGSAEAEAGQPVTITLIGRDARSRAGLSIHRASELHPDDMARRHGLPVTSAARTLIDRAGCVGQLELENDLAEMRRRYPSKVSAAKLDAAITRAPANHRGRSVLIALLEADIDPALTRSKYERKLLRLVNDAELPRPDANATVEGHMVDLVWRRQRVVVEFDGFGYHGGRRAFEVDRRRDADLVAAGYRVIRVTARQLDSHPFQVVARIAAALAMAA